MEEDPLLTEVDESGRFSSDTGESDTGETEQRFTLRIAKSRVVSIAEEAERAKRRAGKSTNADPSRDTWGTLEPVITLNGGISSLRPRPSSPKYSNARVISLQRSHPRCSNPTADKLKTSIEKWKGRPSRRDSLQKPYKGSLQRKPLAVTTSESQTERSRVTRRTDKDSRSTKVNPLDYLADSDGETGDPEYSGQT